MSNLFKISSELLGLIRDDLSRPHSFAFERVGFIGARVGYLSESGWVVLAANYFPVDDADYVENSFSGAEINAAAIRKALQIAYDQPLSIIHVHEHPHFGNPDFSRTDEKTHARLIPNFWNVRPKLPHGAIVLSFDSISGTLWDPGTLGPSGFERITVVGDPIKVFTNNDR